MKNFRVEYYDAKSSKLNVLFLDAEDSNDVKRLWNEKHKSKGQMLAVCETKVYKEMLEKYGKLMRPLM